MKEHLREFHIAAAEHHVALAKLYKARASQLEAEEAEFCEGCQKAHADYAEQHIALARKLERAAEVMPHVGQAAHTHDVSQGVRAALSDDERFDALVKGELIPDGVSVIAAPSMRLIPRAGQQTGPVDTSRLDPAIRDLVET